MSKLGLVIAMILMVGRSNAQNYPAAGNEPLTFFVLIQADNGQPFYVRLNNQLYSSSATGHLILAQLKDSVYTIAVGFPSFPEQRYLLNLHQKDLALRLRQQDDRWGLYDDQGQAVVALADSAALEKPRLAGAKKDDAFSQLMSAIVQDTAVMYNTFADTQVIHDTVAPNTTNINSGSPADTLPSRAALLSSLAVDSTTMKPADTPETTHAANLSAGLPVTLTPAAGPPVSSALDPAVPSSPTGVIKLSEHKSSKSLSLVYADHAADKRADTIDVVIPIDSPVASHRLAALDTAQSKTRRPKYPDTARMSVTSTYAVHTDDYFHVARIPKTPPDTSHSTGVIRRPLSADTSHSHIPATDKTLKPDTPTLGSGASHKSTLSFVNSDCHAFATDYDVDKLRVRMLDANKDEDRIQVAYKVFKTKCFNTKQIRALSEVFTADPAKFKFLATAYPFVSDDQFSELVNLLSDPVYTGKFRTMTDRH